VCLPRCHALPAGTPLDASAAAMLHELLREPLMEEEEHHALRAHGRDVGFDAGSVVSAVSR